VTAKIVTKSTTVCLKELSNVQKRKRLGELLEQGDAVDVKGNYIKKVIKLNFDGGHVLQKNNSVTHVPRSIYNITGEIDFLMFWNWQDLGQQVPLSF
jgi:hypothetical protein